MSSGQLTLRALSLCSLPQLHLPTPVSSGAAVTGPGIAKPWENYAPSFLVFCEGYSKNVWT